MTGHIRRVSTVGMLEGTSFLLLLLVAMPLKYFAGIPEAVMAVGWAHGVLFVLYAAVVFWAWGAKAIPFKWVVFLAIASLIPAGPFLMDANLKKQTPNADGATRPEGG